MTTRAYFDDIRHWAGDGRFSKVGRYVRAVGKRATCPYTIFMHEMAVTQSILDIALEYAERAGATRVTALNLVIGQLSSIVDDSVQFYWDIISKDTICEAAALNFERIPAQMHCLDCDHTYILARGLEACPQCGGFRVRVAGGDEFRLESIEISETADKAGS